MPRKNRLTRARALNAAKMREVARSPKANLLQGSKWKEDCGTIKQEINDLESIEIEAKIEGDDYSKEKDEESRSVTRRKTSVDVEISDMVSIQIEAKIESDDNSKEKDEESGSVTRCQTPVDEELWVVRKRLCRGCHSDGAFWSLQTTTEGDTYGDLLQTHFNIKLCPVSKDELALSAICALCAARLRDARDFSAQAHAAEERFTHFYKLKRVRALVNDVEIKEVVPKIKMEALDNDEDVPKIKKEVYEFEITKDVDPDNAYSKLVHFEMSDDVEQDTVNSKNDNPDSTEEELAPTLNNKKKPQARPYSEFRLSPSDYERVGKLFKCTRCNKLLKRGVINKHVKYTHLKLPQFNCPHCDKTFRYPFQFTKHKLKEHSIDNRIKCNACDWFTYRTKSALNKHKNEIHMLGEKFTCSDCDYFTFSKENLRKHAIKHTNVREHHCKYCKKSFLRKSNLTTHEKIHTEDKRKVCNVCGQAFVQRASLTYHMAKHHPEVRL